MEDALLRHLSEKDQEPRVNADEGTFGVVAATGEYVREETDLRIPGRGIDFVLKRTYRSRTQVSGVLGPGWNFNYNERLIHHTEDGLLEWVRGDSWSDFFTWNPLRGWESFSGFPGLIKEPVTEPLPHGASYGLRDADGLVRYYGGAGELLAVVDRHGNRLEFHHDPQLRLTEVIDTMGRVIRFAYSSQTGLLETVTDFMGRTISYGYEDGKLVSVSSPWVTLAEGAPPRRLTTSYAYSSSPDQRLSGNLVALTDARGVEWLGLTYGQREHAPAGGPDPAYDRVIGLRRGDGGPGAPEITFAYENLEPQANDPAEPVRRTTITSRRGSISERDYDRRNRLLQRRELFNPQIADGVDSDSVTSYQYALQSGRLLRVVHPEGNETRYFYNGRTVFCPDCAEGPQDPYRAANITRIVQVAGPRGDGRGNPAADRVTDIVFDPIYNQESARVDPAGHVWRQRFDYEELDCTGPERQALLAYAARWSLDEAVAQAAGCGAGDLNLDGRRDGRSGLVLREEKPAAILADGRRGPAPATLYHHNRHGQVVKIVDADGFIVERLYYPETAPHDGLETTAPPPGRVLDPESGGYLRAVIRDADDPALGRFPGASPEPARLRRDQVLDAAGLVVRITDARGVVHTTLRNELGWPLRFTLAADVAPPPRGEAGLVPLRRAVSLEYDENFNVVSRRMPAGQAAGEARERLVIQEFDALNHVRRVSRGVIPGNPEMTTTWYERDGSENVVRIVSGEGRVTRMEYDHRDRLFRTRRYAARLAVPPGSGTSLPPRDDQRDRVEELELDRQGAVLARRRRQTEPGSAPAPGRERRHVYNGFGELIEVRDEACGLLQMVRDQRGDETAREFRGPTGGPTPAAGPSCPPDLPVLSRVESQRDALGRVTLRRARVFARGEDPAAGPLPSTWGEWSETTRRFDLRGNLVREADARGRTLLYVHDGAGRMTCRRLGEAATPDGPVAVRQETTLDYNGTGLIANWLVRDLDDDGDGTAYRGEFEYDAAGGLVAAWQNLAEGPMGESFVRDSAGQVIGHTGPGGEESAFELDGLGRIIAIRSSVRNPDGTPDLNFANADGEVLWRYTYSPDGTLIARTDDRGHTTTWSRDGLGQVVLATRPDGSRRRTVWDADGHPLVVEVRGAGHADADPAPLTHVMDYDSLGRLTHRRAMALPASGLDVTPEVSLEYDGAGRLTRVVSAGDARGRGSEIRRAYDSLGNLVAEEQTFLGVTRRLEAEHDGARFRRRLRLISAGVPELEVAYLPDGLGRLAQVQVPGLLQASYAYRGAGRELRRTLNLPVAGGEDYALVRDAVWDQAGRVQALVYSEGAALPPRAVFEQAFDPGGRPRVRHAVRPGVSGPDAEEGVLLEHDSLGRLRSRRGGAWAGTLEAPEFNGPADTWAFVLDGAGNHAEVAHGDEVRRHLAGPMNFYEVVGLQADEQGAWSGGTLQGHDLLGNLQREERDGIVLLYRHDGFGRLTAIEREPADGGAPVAVAWFSYDGLGRRIESDVAGGSRRTWVHDGGRVVAEYGYETPAGRDDPAAPARRLAALNLHGRGVDEVLLALRDLDGQEGLEAVRLPVVDLQGSVTALLDQRGQVMESYTYSPFGQRRVLGVTGPLVAGTQDYSFGFAGRRHEVFTAVNRQLIQMRHRSYDPSLGRFLEPDPLGARDDPNLYAYAGNAPDHAADPLGLFGVGAGVDGPATGLTAQAAADSGFSLLPGWQGGGPVSARATWTAAADHWNSVARLERNDGERYELYLRWQMTQRRRAVAGVVASSAQAEALAAPEPCPPGFHQCVTVTADRPDSQLLHLLETEARRLAAEERMIRAAQADRARHMAARSVEIGVSAEAIPFFFGFGLNAGIIVDSMGNIGLVAGQRSQACCGVGVGWGGYLGTNEGSIFMQDGERAALGGAVGTPWGGAGYAHDQAGGDSGRLFIAGPSLLVSFGVALVSQTVVAFTGEPPQAPPPAMRRPPGLYRKE